MTGTTRILIIETERQSHENSPHGTVSGMIYQTIDNSPQVPHVVLLGSVVLPHLIKIEAHGLIKHDGFEFVFI